MNKKWQKFLATALAAALLLGCCSGTALAAGPEKPSAALGVLYDAADWAVKTLFKGILALIPPIGIPKEFPEGKFLPGEASFSAAAPGAWKLGYARGSLLEGYEGDVSKLYVTGSLAPLGNRTVTKVLDPPMARVTSLSDGRVTAVFVSLDVFGITSADVRAIRAAVPESLLQAHNITSINVSALHQHSVVDTLGMNGNLIAGLFLNPLARLTHWYPIFSGKNPAYMRRLTDVTAGLIAQAAGHMEAGALHYGKVNIKEYIRDKRAPEQFDEYFHRLRFTPADSAKAETWLCNLAIHCVGYGIDGTEVTGDFPYFIEKAVSELPGAPNFQLIQGAQLAITLNNPSESDSAYQRIEDYGRALAAKLGEISSEDDLPALLHIAHREFTMPVDNPLHMLMARLGLLESTMRKTSPLATKMEIKSEIGYMELGNTLAVALVPGEMEPCLAYGGGLTADEAWKGVAYDFTPMRDVIPAGRELLVFGLTNDQVGYILLPNDVNNFILFGNEEINASCSTAADYVLGAFKGLVGGVR